MPKNIWTPNTKKIWSEFQFLESIFSLFTSFPIARTKEQSHAQPWLCYGRGHSQKNEGERKGRGRADEQKKKKTGKGWHLLLIKWLKLLQMKLVNSTFNSGKVMNGNTDGCFPRATEDIDDTKKEAAQHLVSRQKGIYGICHLTNNSEFLENIMFLNIKMCT